MSTPNPPDIDWSITTFEGARREQMRRWAELPLIEILAALEELEILANTLGTPTDRATDPPPDNFSK